LRHISHSFTVEVKRHRGRSASSDAKPVLSLGLAEAVRNIEAESNQRPKAPPSDPLDNGNRATPKAQAGRVLPSLIESAQWTFPPDGAELRSAVRDGPPVEDESAVKKRGGARRRRRTASQQQPSGPADPNADPSTGGDSEEPSWDSILSASGARGKRPALRRRKPAGRTSPERWVESYIHGNSDDAASAASELREASQSRPSESPAAIEHADSGERKVRSRKILGRYVFGTEPKLGERWKRRFKKPR
jgi:hypothetical protein